MKKTFLIVLLLLSCVFIFAQLNPWIWVKNAGGTDSDYGYGIAVDASGNSYVTGYFTGSAIFGSTTLTSNGGSDIFIAKLDSSGNWLWAKNAGGTSFDYGSGIAVDASGNSYVTGYFADSATFGSTSLTSNGYYDIFIAKLDSSGNWLWAKNAGGTGTDGGYSIAVDASGNSYVTGTFGSATATFGSTTLTSNGGFDIFITKLDSSGYWLWAKNAGGTSDDYGNGIAVDDSGNSYVIGDFYSNATFGSTTLTSNGGYDIFIAKLDSSGNWLWAQNAGGTYHDYGYGIAVDASGNTYVTGGFEGTATFGSTTLTSNGGYDIFIAKLDNSGNWLWAQNAGGTGYDEGYCIAVDANGNSYVTGEFSSSATFGFTTIESYGSWDIFIAKLDSSGNWLWAKNAGGTGTDGGYSIAVDASRNSYVTGYFEGTSTAGSTFGNITIYGSGTSSNDDIFVTKVHIPYYPAGVSIVEETYGIPVTVTGGDADRGRVDNFPLIPNHSATYKKFNFILDNSIATWTIKMQTNHTYGAYYQNNQWNVVNGDGTQVIFNINFSGTKEEVEIPIILGNENPALPVELSSFTAYISPQNKINIMWTTQTETGLLGYYIMRSTQNELTTAHIVSPLIPATNSSQPRTYLYTDEEVTESRTYYYWLQCNDLDGTINIYGSVSIDYNPGGNTTPSILVTELQPIYPNPFNPIAYIPYTLETKSEVKINIYNTRGQVVKTFDLGAQEKGHHRITWDGRDNDGNLTSNGIYYIVMKAGKESFQRKAVLMK